MYYLITLGICSVIISSKGFKQGEELYPFDSPKRDESFSSVGSAYSTFSDISCAEVGTLEFTRKLRISAIGRAPLDSNKELESNNREKSPHLVTGLPQIKVDTPQSKPSTPKDGTASNNFLEVETPKSAPEEFCIATPNDSTSTEDSGRKCLKCRRVHDHNVSKSSTGNSC